ncbi:MAG TPA: hypothetical protein VFB70_18985 [Pyrinomonadaceae bacterium]|nr:hypothetical protein [Pyrinomonadaceae bacterium]
MRSYDYTIFADYFQFYLQDEEVEGDLSDAWTEEAFNNLLAVVPGTIGVGTVRNMNVPVTVEILESEPLEELDKWDHVNECDIEINSGRLVIAGCTDYFPEAERIEVEPGSYRARIYYGDLDALSEDGLDGDDHYRIALWKSEPKGVRVVKRRGE